VATRRFTPEYSEVVTLRDGARVVLRLVRPDDRDLLRRGFERWSAESRYARFFSAKTNLSDDELTYLCEVDQENHFALGAAREDDPGVGVGIARFIRLPEHEQELGAPITAEAAIAVADEAHGQGLGRILLERLVAAAGERGIERFRCEVLGTNAGMKHLIEKIAPARTVEVSQGVMSIDFDVPATVTDQAGEESALYRFFRGVAKMGPWGLIASRWSQS
jgi:GNAT superfamily N-acetyltransferase